jgi:hypothetical protein
MQRDGVISANVTQGCARLAAGYGEIEPANREGQGEERQDLLSNDVVVVRCVHLEGAVVGPQVYGGCNTRDAALVDHLGRLGAANGELEVGVLLPVSEEEGEFGQEAVVYVAHQLDGGWAGVARDAALEVRRTRDERFPSLKVVFVLYLQREGQWEVAVRWRGTYD